MRNKLHQESNAYINSYVSRLHLFLILAEARYLASSATSYQERHTILNEDTRGGVSISSYSALEPTLFWVCTTSLICHFLMLY